jgi:hypothetical protein
MPITIVHKCGHESKVDGVTQDGTIPTGSIELDPNKDCPQCQTYMDYYSEDEIQAGIREIRQNGSN